MFEEKYNAIIKEIVKLKAQKRCIFLLDQYGYTDVTFSCLNSIAQQLGRAEVILNFAVDHLIDFLTNKSTDSNNLLESIDIPRESIEKILRQIGNKEKKEWKRIIQHLLHNVFLQRSGFPYYTPFFVTSSKSNRSYWLLHFSKHPTARDAMMDIHWRYGSFEHFGKPGLYMLGFNPKKDGLAQKSEPLLFPEYQFDQTACEETKGKLSNELPEHMYDIESTSFKNLYRDKCNFTPANRKIFKEALQPAIDDKDIEAISKEGSVRRKSNAIKDTDTIRVPKQKKLFFFTGYDKND